MSKRFIFVGVTTAESSMVRIFPYWRTVLGLPSDVELVGRDFPLHAPPQHYRELLLEVKAQADIVGALVTTHKIDLYSAGADLFEGVDHYAELLGEVSCIAPRDDRLLGWAKDPIAAGRALESILRGSPGGLACRDVVCFGAGGAGHAITLYILTTMRAESRPQRLVVTDPDPDRLHRLRTLHERLQTDVPIDYLPAGDSAAGDTLVAKLSPGSLVINATGMGKDRPGSPVSDAVRYPQHAIAWELNYRGQLQFLHSAWRQREERDLQVKDGWEYFILGWATVLEEVFERPIDDVDLARLSQAAAFARPPLPTWTTNV